MILILTKLLQTIQKSTYVFVHIGLPVCNP